MVAILKGNARFNESGRRMLNETSKDLGRSKLAKPRMTEKERLNQVKKINKMLKQLAK
jgi:hypothetical protein